jgi:hypothetical protein
VTTSVTFCFVNDKPSNVQFIWDDAGPGLQIVWSEQADIVGQVVRGDAGLKQPGMFQHLTELLSGA